MTHFLSPSRAENGTVGGTIVDGRGTVVGRSWDGVGWSGSGWGIATRWRTVSRWSRNAENRGAVGEVRGKEGFAVAVFSYFLTQTVPKVGGKAVLELFLTQTTPKGRGRGCARQIMGFRWLFLSPSRAENGTVVGNSRRGRSGSGWGIATRWRTVARWSRNAENSGARRGVRGKEWVCGGGILKLFFNPNCAESGR